jgi:hypothetical protein
VAAGHGAVGVAGARLPEHDAENWIPVSGQIMLKLNNPERDPIQPNWITTQTILPPSARRE